MASFNFSTADWLLVSTGTNILRIALLADPPVAANIGLVIYSRPINDIPGIPPEWSKVATGVIDNLAYTSATPAISFSISPNTYYTVQLQGEAHLLLPGYDEISLQINLLNPDGDVLYDYGGIQTQKVHSAGIVGLTYLERRG